MATSIKISQLTPKGANLESTDLLEISEFDGSGYVTKSITGQEIIDAASGGGSVTDVTATAPIVSTGGTTPDISMAPADSGHDGYLTSTDWNTFNDKQDALVSATNIKTINGSSVLGSGDLVVGGGGGNGVHALVKPRSGQSSTTMVAPGTLGTLNVTQNRIYAIPFIPNNTFTTSSFYINVTNNQVGTNAKIMIYSNLDGQPDSLLYESTNLDCSTLGIKTATTAFTFNSGTTYWFCFWGSAIIGVSSIAISNQSLIGFNGVTVITSYVQTVTFGSAPNPFGTSTNNNGAYPFIGATI